MNPLKSVTVHNGMTRLQVWEGERNGETILFLHPQGSISTIWGKMLPYFSEQYHSVCMDLRGQGDSEKAASGYDIETQCRDILAVLDHLQVERAHLVGNSLGGDFATFFAATYPERTLSLINLDSAMIDYIGPNGESAETREEVLERFRKREIMAFDNREQMMEYARTYFTPWDSYWEGLMNHVGIYTVDNGRIAYQIPTHINLQIMETVCDLHYEQDAYPYVQCPILFLPAEAEKKLQEKLDLIERVSKHPKNKTVIIPGSRHLLPIDQPDQVSKEIIAFLDGLRA